MSCHANQSTIMPATRQEPNTPRPFRDIPAFAPMPRPCLPAPRSRCRHCSSPLSRKRATYKALLARAPHMSDAVIMRHCPRGQRFNHAAATPHYACRASFRHRHYRHATAAKKSMAMPIAAYILSKIRGIGREDTYGEREDGRGSAPMRSLQYAAIFTPTPAAMPDAAATR